MPFAEDMKTLPIHVEAFVGFVVEESDVKVALSTPRAVAAHACAIALEDKGFAAQNPSRIAFAIA